MIKNPLNFYIGIFCIFMFVLAVALKRDAFTICLDGFLAIFNIWIGLFW